MKLLAKFDNVEILKFDFSSNFYLSSLHNGILKTTDFLSFEPIYLGKIHWFEIFGKGLIIQDKQGESLKYLSDYIKSFDGNYYLDASKNNSNGLTIISEDEKGQTYNVITYNLELIKRKDFFPLYFNNNKAVTTLGPKVISFINLISNHKKDVSLINIGHNEEEISRVKFDNQLDSHTDLIHINNKIVGLLQGGQIVAFNVNTGDQIWLFSPDDKQVWVEQDGACLYSIGLNLYEINPENGKILRSMPILDEIIKNDFESFYSPMRIYGDYAVLWHSFTKDIFIINLRDFRFEKMLKVKIDWEGRKIGLPVIFNATIIYHNSLLYILDDSKKLLIFEKEETEELVQEIIISKETYLAASTLPL